MADSKHIAGNRELAKKCAFVSRSELYEFLERKSTIEDRFKVKTYPPKISSIISCCESDCIGIFVEGPKKNVLLAMEYLAMLSSCVCSKTIEYPGELEKVLGNKIWMQVLESAFHVIIRQECMRGLKICGETRSKVNRAVAAVQEIINRLEDHSNYDISCEVSELLRSDIPTIVKSCLNTLRELPSPMLKVLLSWIRIAYNVMQCDESIIVVDESVIIVDDESELNEGSHANNESVDDKAEESVIALDSPVRKEESVITISDDDDDNPGDIAQSSGIQGNNKRFRAMDGSAVPVVEEAKAVFIPLRTKKRKKRDHKSDLQHVPPAVASTSVTATTQELSERLAVPSVPKPVLTVRKLRPIVIDGSNVAFQHGQSLKEKVFSSRGILLAVEYFLNRGHSTITAFVPQFRRCFKAATEQNILEELHDRNIVVFTPSRNVRGKCVTCYDDKFIVKLAHNTGGVILSNDNYRDIIAEYPEWRTTIEERLLMFCFAAGMLMIPDDPLGMNGPKLDDFLSFPPSQ